MKCIFCGKSAGLIKREHPECRALAEEGKKYLRECIDYIYNNRDCMNISEVVSGTIAKYNIPHEMANDFLLECWNDKVLVAFEDRIIDYDEIKILKEMLVELNIYRNQLESSEQWKRLKQYGKTFVFHIIETAVQNKDFSQLQKHIDWIADLYEFDNETIQQFAFEYWKHFSDKALKNGILAECDEYLINHLTVLFNFDLSKDGYYQQNIKIVKGALLRDVTNGVIPHRIANLNDFEIPIAFHKNETVIWPVKGLVTAYEEVIHHKNGIESVEKRTLGKGILIVTNRNIYWTNTLQNRVIQANKISTIIPYSDGITIIKNGVTARPLTLELDDPDFYYKLFLNLKRIS